MGLLIVGFCILAIVAIGAFLAWIATGGLQATLRGDQTARARHRPTFGRLLLVVLALALVVMGLYWLFGH
jgi:hypothetical protein